MTEELTDRLVKTIAAPAGKQLDIYDKKVTGLALRVSPQGRRTWNLLYRSAGRKRRLKLATYPVMSLADARKAALTRLNEVANGKDPAAQKQRERAAETFADLVTEYLEKWARPRKRTAYEDERILNRDVLPSWRNRRIDDIHRRDVRALLERIADRAPIMANRCAQLLSKVFNYAIEHELTETNPVYRMTTIGGKERVRDRVLSPEEIRAVWLALDQEPAKERDLFRLGLLTAARRGELLGLAWSELTEPGWWTIP
ncbi:MAG TPA: integrase family protein, partial [Candidatus Binataceae bacterium]|nr:integrase family protein [Candidatus Binataceae bacterium]